MGKHAAHESELEHIQPLLFFQLALVASIDRQQRTSSSGSLHCGCLRDRAKREAELVEKGLSPSVAAIQAETDLAKEEASQKEQLMAELVQGR